jgi:3-hydroxyisobutyrate dehydrogenase-like beta-hydroxyacid dehydrogenase
LASASAMSTAVSLVGFGEAGQTFAAAAPWAANARAYDRLTDCEATRRAKEADYRRAAVDGVSSMKAAVEGAEIVLSLVTAGQALSAAVSAAGFIEAGALFCDMNSAAPATKRSAAAAIEAAGGIYLDVAVMAPVNPLRLAVPLLISGGEAEAAATRLETLGFTDVRTVGPNVGHASSIKLIRSVIVKGMEALTAEAMLAAHRAGVAEEVIASLDASDRNEPWAKRADYNLDRMIVHGLRRAEEMGEVVKTLEDLGVEPLLTRGTAQRQREIGGLQLGRPSGGLCAKLEQIQARKADAA